MAFAVKVDEDLPAAVVRLLKTAGYNALAVTEQGMGGWKDGDLWRAVQAEKRFLITADKGIADIRVRPPGKHSGILLLRPERESIPAMVELVERVLAVYNLADLAGTITVATSRGLRVRRL